VAIEVDAFLADSVSVAGGQLFAHGAGWDHLRVAAIPARPGRIGIALFLRVPREQAGSQIELTACLVGPDGEAIGGVSGRLRDTGPPEDSPLASHVTPLGFNLDDLVFDAAGEHALVVEVNGAEVLRRPFAVVASG
jgi:hypothetical protein